MLADARAAAEAARHDADAARSEGRGHLALNADGGFLGVNPGPTFRDNGGGEFLFGFSMPLFDGGAIAARTAAATAVSASAEANVGQVRQTWPSRSRTPAPTPSARTPTPSPGGAPSPPPTTPCC